MIQLRPYMILKYLRRQNSLLFSNTLCTSDPRVRKSKVPQQPVDADVSDREWTSATNIDIELVQHLEKLSLVDFANKEGLLRLQAAISLADKLSEVNTEGVKPLYTVLENRCLALADDEVLVDNMIDDILGCAKETLEDYFVVPPGNIDYIPEDAYYEKLKDKDEKK